MLNPSRLPSSAELDRRLEASRELASRGEHHIDVARRNQTENNMAAMIAEALGLPSGHTKGGRHAED